MTYAEALNTEDIEYIDNEFCQMMQDIVHEVKPVNEDGSELGYCELCPFNKLCSLGKSGFIAWLKQEWD